MRSLAGLLVLMASAPALAPAMAQEFVAPRFPALEQQQARTEQQRIDDLEREAVRADLLGQSPGLQAPADRALRRLELDRDTDLIRLEGEMLRAQSNRLQVAVEAGLPNRRIARGSVLAVADPAAAGLAAAPKGQFYARLEGVYVLVDATSELVVAVLPATQFGPQDSRQNASQRPVSEPWRAGR
jgi:Ni/Co efflux regulator RcnB